MAANHSNTYILNANMGYICSVIRDPRFCMALKLNLKGEIPMQGATAYRFGAGVNFRSWGENIDINVLYFNENTSQVIIKSECAFPTQIIDWGKNKANVEQIYNYLLSSIAYNPTVNYAQPQQMPMGNFCKNCGTQLGPNSRFCQICGWQVL